MLYGSSLLEGFLEEDIAIEYSLKEFASLLQGKPTLQLSLRNKEYTDTKVFGVCSDTVSCQGRTL